MMMMMMMSILFVERVINGPQTRCRSAEQVGLQISTRANVNGERVAVSSAVGKLFQMTGPATANLFISSVVLVLGADSIPVPSDRSCLTVAGQQWQRLPDSRPPSTSAPIHVYSSDIFKDWAYYSAVKIK